MTHCHLISYQTELALLLSTMLCDVPIKSGNSSNQRASLAPSYSAIISVHSVTQLVSQQRQKGPIAIGGNETHLSLHPKVRDMGQEAREREARKETCKPGRTVMTEKISIHTGNPRRKKWHTRWKSFRRRVPFCKNEMRPVGEPFCIVTHTHIAFKYILYFSTWWHGMA